MGAAHSQGGCCLLRQDHPRNDFEEVLDDYMSSSRPRGKRSVAKMVEPVPAKFRSLKRRSLERLRPAGGMVYEGDPKIPLPAEVVKCVPAYPDDDWLLVNKVVQHLRFDTPSCTLSASSSSTTLDACSGQDS
eukprot:Sspe_Gene.2472::Locus_819_Transcript_12_13_Confidence_0.037_Length_2299::g.2472::m.2472